MDSQLRPALAEFFGTFTLVFIGVSAGALAGPTLSAAGIVGVALAHGLALTVIIYAWGSISGAHVNPAVTFGVLLTGKIPFVKAMLYWFAQFAGALLAAFLLFYLLEGETPGLAETTGVFTEKAPLKAVIVEAVLTFFLIIAVIGSGVYARNGGAYGLAIGLVLAMDILAGGHLTGASMNPARTLGPAVASGNFGYLWIYFVGPLIGAGVGAVIYDRMFMRPEAAAANNK